MLLEPPGLTPAGPRRLPHWPYLEAVDDALTSRRIPPGTVRIECTGREYGERMYLVLVWDVSRTAGSAGIRLHWDEDTGWAYAMLGANPRIKSPRQSVDSLRRVFATPDDVAEVAGQLVHGRHAPVGDYSTEWEGAAGVRAAIDTFRT
ncbi:DUF6292 family protein [Streptomyces sp. NPDC047082]|uniref:DUF6292 family protein n=1 Tax=Streptomyces sp. NPDC047082 TaxID=3155259 RepID=UPI0033C2C945